jgi:diguanylate cyclase (GGDEF)-like protein/PAS domain S-box-containing protein
VREQTTPSGAATVEANGDPTMPVPVTEGFDPGKTPGLSQFLLDQAPAPVLAIDEAGRIRYANAAAAATLGRTREQLAAMTVFDIAPHRRPDSWRQSVAALRQSGVRAFESEWLHSDGRGIPVDISSAYLEYEDTAYVVIYATDTSARREAEQQALRLARFDEVTGLPNRTLLQDRLRGETQQAAREGRRIALLCVGVDQAGLVNEAHGQAEGDLLLHTLAKRLCAGLRGSDTMAHLGGGEFALLLAREGDVDDALALVHARQLLEAFGENLPLGGRQVVVTGHIGVALFPQDADQPEQLLRQAQIAKRMAQGRGTNQICFYTAEADERAGTRLEMEAALRQALQHGDLCLHYQPQVDLATGRLAGFEALVRWRDAQRGEVPAEQVIDLAEDSGLMLRIGEWVLRTACEANARWQKLGLPAVRVSVNLSSHQLKQADIASRIESLLMQTGLDPHFLAVEVTESMLMQDFEHVCGALGDLKSIGVEIALDDFGTGYSSLSSLRRLPIDVIKIDRSFVPDVTASTEDVSITRAVINMAHSLQRKVLAVGVENDGQLALLVANGCDQIQGYYFSAPVSDAEAEAMLREGRRLPEEALGRKARRRTLLLVDDEENIVSSLRRLLRRDGYHIITANSGLQGLQRLAENEVDVIVSDQRMPGMTGVEFLRRAKELYPDTIRLVLSGYTELQSITDAVNEGAIYKFLTKPWDDERVRAHIEEAFRQKEMADENRRLDREVQDANRELAEVNGKLQRLLVSQREQIDRDETSLVIAREVLENIPAPVIGFDLEGLLVFMNPDAETLFPAASALLGCHAQEALPPALLAVWQASDGLYHPVQLEQRPYQAVCRAMTDVSRSHGRLMVLTPTHGALAAH